MISFYTFFGFDCGFTSSSRTMQDMVTQTEKLWPYYYKYAEICKISPNFVWNEDEQNKSNK